MSDIIGDEVPWSRDRPDVIVMCAECVRFPPRVGGEPHNARRAFDDFEPTLVVERETQCRVAGGDAMEGAIHMCGVPSQILGERCRRDIFDLTSAVQAPVTIAVDDAHEPEGWCSRLVRKRVTRNPW